MWQDISELGKVMSTLWPPAPRRLLRLSLFQEPMSGKKLPYQKMPLRPPQVRAGSPSRTSLASE